MEETPPRIDSRARRFLAYLHYNRQRLLVDFIVLTAWVVGTWSLFGYLAFPTWLTYLLIFVGVIFYSRITPTWERPYVSPDMPPSEPGQMN